MRLAVVVAPSIAKASSTARRVSLLADRLADRLVEPDAGYVVEVLEARGRLGERLASVLRERGGRGPTLLFVSSDLALTDDGPALALAGGASLLLAELRATLTAQADEVLLVLDAQHPADPDDPTLSATFVDAVHAAIAPKESGISLLVGARPAEVDGPTTSPFASAFLAALDTARAEVSRAGSVGAERLYELLRADADRFHEIPAAGWFRGRGDFPVLVERSIVVGGAESAPPSRGSGRPSASRSVRPSIPPGARTPAFEEAWSLGKAAAAEGRHAAAIDHYKKALLLLGQRPERAEVYYRIGQAKAALGSPAEALHNFDKALGVEPLHHEAFTAAAELLERDRDYVRLERLLRRRLEARSDVDAKLKELAAIARVWLDKAREPVRAIPALEDWVRLREDPEGLGLLIEALGAAGRHGAANAARQRLAKLHEGDPATRARVLLAAAQTAARHLPGGGDALELARAALDADPSLLEALEVAATALGTRRRWRELAELYEGLLARVSDDVVVWDLAKKLGLLYRDQLGDRSRAIAAFTRACASNPTDAELCFWLADLHEASHDHAAAAEDMRRAAFAAPGRAEVYRRALWCFDRTGQADSAWAAAAVLDQLGEADINESLLADTHRPEGLLAARGSFGDREWALLRPERDEPLERLLARVAPAAMALRRRDLDGSGVLPRLGEATLQNPAGTTTLMRSLVWTARLLGSVAPAVHVLPSVEGELAPLPLEEPTCAASRAVASGLELPELAFLWGRVLAYLRPEHQLAIYYPTAPDVAKLLLGCLAVAGVSEAEGDAAAVAGGLDELLDAALRDDLARAARELTTRRLRTRVASYVRGVHAAAGRAGLVACGDIARAGAVVSRFPLVAGLSAEEQVADLRAFAISAQHARIREHLGVAVRG